MKSYKRLTGAVSAGRFSQGPAAGRRPGGHLVAPGREQGGPADAAVLPARRGGLRGGEPDDADQRRRLPGAVALPPQHPEERRQRGQVSRGRASPVTCLIYSIYFSLLLVMYRFRFFKPM